MSEIRFIRLIEDIGTEPSVVETPTPGVKEKNNAKEEKKRNGAGGPGNKSPAKSKAKPKKKEKTKSRAAVRRPETVSKDSGN